MGRFDRLATSPARGPADIFKWKVVDKLRGKNRADSAPFEPERAEYNHALIASRGAELTWIGHATFLLTLSGKHILLDPNFAPRIGPVKRIGAPGIPIEELPPIDVVLITHNHRDHLDTWSLDRLPGEPRFVVPVGNAKHIAKKGRTVDELDWWRSLRIDALTVTLVPSRHWSMRFPWDRNDALWGGFVVSGEEGTAYHSGDTAMFEGFEEIGRRCGPIDWAMLPIGAYEPRWFMKPQHMSPDEAVEAFAALRARVMVAMHWATFKLTDEPLAEPKERVLAAWASFDADGRELWIPRIGETRRLVR